MNRPKNLYRIKQKLAVFGYRFMPFYSEEWKQYLMEASEYYIEAYRGLRQVVSIDKEVSGVMGGVVHRDISSKLATAIFIDYADPMWSGCLSWFDYL